MSRLLRIAAREYISYIRTVGFWLSLILMPAVLFVATAAPKLVNPSAASPRLAIVDLTGEAIGRALHDRLIQPPAPFSLVAPPPEAQAAANATLAGVALRRAMASHPGFDLAVVLSGGGPSVSLDLWTTNLADDQVQSQLRAAVAEVMREHRLIAAGVSPQVIAAADAAPPRLTVYSPKAAGGGLVSWRDRLPGVAGVIMGVLLWSVIFTGAGPLLNSVIEEKGNRILEVLLSSASSSEILGGKILGGAGVTATVLGLWGTAAGTALALQAPSLGADIIAALLAHGLIAYFAVYLVIGYLMYASIFAGIGAFCETSREAQTLLGPLMLMLTIPIIFMGQAIEHPDAPVLQALSWVPLFTPFLMVARVASNPPLWQVAGTLIVMTCTAAGVVWLAGRAFRAGALSFGRVDRRTILAALMGRRP